MLPTEIRTPLETLPQRTALAPLLLQIDGLITEVLSKILGTEIRPHILEHRLERGHFTRRSVLYGGDLPLYVATTVIPRARRTKNLIRDLRRHPETTFGMCLKAHRLFHHKGEPTVREVTTIPEYYALFGAPPGSILWERSYAIITPRGDRIAGVTELFNPKLEDLLRTRTSLPLPSLSNEAATSG